jgi:DNA-binding XRE family transcriptional regulator
MRRIPRGKGVTIEGRPYVILPKEEYERLCHSAEAPPEDASTYAVPSVGSDLRARRHKAGMTLAQVALKARIAPETLSRIENGRTNPSVGTVRSILLALEGDR